MSRYESAPPYHRQPTDAEANDRRVKGGSMPYFDRRALGRRLQLLREARSMTAAQIAARLDRCEKAIRAVELGRYVMSVGVLDQWLRIFDVDLLALLGAR